MNKLAEFLPAFMHFSRLENTNLILLLGIILLLGAFGGTVFKKLKIPQVVGYIVIGIIIGQSGFQILSAQIITALDPLSSIALALIGFLIGGELKTKVIKKYGTQFVGILIFESIVPFITVSIVVSLVAYFVTKDFASSISLGLILGSISSATAPAATTDVLRENRTRGPLTTTVLGIVAMDDAVALIMAMKYLEVLGICAVGGNTGLSNTLRNALFITELAERSDIPVYAGYDYPMFSKPERAEYVHGKGGLGNIEVGELTKKSENAHAVDFIIDTFIDI